MSTLAASRLTIFFAVSTVLAAPQKPGHAYEQKWGEWRMVFNGIQKNESVVVTITSQDASTIVKGTPANLGIIFKSVNPKKFSPKQSAKVGRPYSVVLEEPVVVKVRSKGKELMQIIADRVEIDYEKGASDTSG
jgi:hypothetical protein